MSFLKDENYKQITEPGSFHRPIGDSLPVTGTVTQAVPTIHTFWTVAIDGPDVTYQLQVRGIGMPSFRDVEEGIVDGTVAGFVANFRGSVEAIQIVPASGAAYTYSMVGKSES